MAVGVITAKGREKLCKAHAGAMTLPKITKMAFGNGGVDSSGNVIATTGNETALKHQLLIKNIDSYNKKDTNVHVSLTEKQAWNSKASTALASTTSNGLMSAADKTAIINLSTTINNSITSQKILKALENNSSGLDADLLDGKHASEFATSNHLHNLATTTANGLMSANDKIKLDGFESSASNLENGKSTGSLQMKGCNKDIEDNGIYSFAEGYQTETGSGYSHTEGFKTLAFSSRNIIEIALTSLPIDNRATKFKIVEKKDATKVAKLLNRDILVFSTGYLTGTTIIDINGLDITLSNSIYVDEYWASVGGCALYLFSRDEINSDGYPAGEHGSSHAEGKATIALGDSSHSEGYNSSTTGNYSHAEGHYTCAGGFASHAEGENSTAIGSCSHAENCSIATGRDSHAEGVSTLSSGYASHAQNYLTTSDSSYSTAIGILNKKMVDNDLFTIGNGAETYESISDGGINIIYTNSNILRVTKSAIYGTGPFNTSGADYAEYFEWQDKNLENEDMVGLFVTFDNEDKIRIANSNDDYILGIISATPTVIGNSYNDQWQGMNVRDDFGRVQYHEVEIPEQKRVIHHEAEYEPVIDEDTKETTQKLIREAYDEEMLICEARKEIQPILNPDFNPNEEFIGREKRKEWAAVGMLGVLKVYDDGTCKVNGYCKVNDEGKATVSDKGYRVIKRIKENIIEVLFR